MNYQIPEIALPGNLEISDKLTEEEEPGFIVPNIMLKQPKRGDAGIAFHEKLAKNRKVNVKIRYAEKMMKKYGKPKTRGAKKK